MRFWSVEESQRVGGFLFLGVPFFDFIQWLLDTIGRWQLLVSIFDRLPPFLTSRPCMFGCMLIGVILLEASHRTQIRTILQDTEKGRRRILDSTGSDIPYRQGRKWILEGTAVVVVALVAIPLIAVHYDLSYKGAVPQTGSAPTPPFWAYQKPVNPLERPPRMHQPPVPAKQVQQNEGSSNTNTQIGTARAPVAIAPGGFANAAPNMGTQTLNNFGPPQPQYTATEEVITPASDSTEKVMKIHIRPDRPAKGAVIGVIFSGPIDEIHGQKDISFIPLAYAWSARVGLPLQQKDGETVPNSLGLIVDLPSVFTPDEEFTITIRSKTDVHVSEIGAIGQ